MPIDIDNLARLMIEELHDPWDLSKRIDIAKKYLNRMNENLVVNEGLQPFSYEDLIAGTQTIYGEARAEPFEGQLAVAYVILNRLSRPAYFRAYSIWEVCHQPLQFSMWNNSTDKNLEIVMHTPWNYMPFLTSMSAMLAAITKTMEDPTRGADHYHAIEIRPNWAELSKLTANIGRHRFYKLASK